MEGSPAVFPLAVLSASHKSRIFSYHICSRYITVATLQRCGGRKTAWKASRGRDDAGKFKSLHLSWTTIPGELTVDQQSPLIFHCFFFVCVFVFFFLSVSIVGFPEVKSYFKDVVVAQRTAVNVMIHECWLLLVLQVQLYSFQTAKLKDF